MILRNFISLSLIILCTAFQAPAAMTDISYFIKFVRSFDVAGVSTFGVKNTLYKKKYTLQPGFEETFNFDLAARRNKLHTKFQLESHYGHEWDKLVLDLFKLSIHHKILFLNVGDFYENIGPLSIQNQNIRGVGIKSSFDLFDEFINVDMTFRIGRSRAGSRVGEPLIGQYGIADSLGLNPRNIGYARFNAKMLSWYLSLIILQTEDVTVKSDSTDIDTVANKPFPLRNRIIGSDIQFIVPGENHKLAGSFFLSTSRENTNDIFVKEDILNGAVLLHGQGRIKNYGYNASYKFTGKKYITGGNPYLLNDRHGFKMGAKYLQKGLGSAKLGMGWYKTNLDKEPGIPLERTLTARFRLDLNKKNVLPAYLSVRFKSENSDTVHDLTQPQQYTKVETQSMWYEFGSTYQYKKLWISSWLDYIHYLNKGTYPNTEPLAVNNDQWITGIRDHIKLSKNVQFFNGISVYFLLPATGGIKTERIHLYNTAVYRTRLRPIRIEAGFELLSQQSTIADQDFSMYSISFTPQYALNSRSNWELGYELNIYRGALRSFSAHTLKAETKWIF